jgi:N4-gp56 family major capsid protein
MPYTTTSTLDDIVPTIIAEAMHTIRANALFAPGGIGEKWLQVRSLEGAPGKTMDFPTFSQFTAYDVNEGTDYDAPEALSTSKVSLTATEKIAMTTITDLALESARDDVAREAGRELGLAVASKIDTDVMALFDNLNTTVGSTGVNCSYQNLLDAINALSAASAPSPYLCVLHPQQWYDLLTEASSPLTASTGYGRMAEEVGYNYFVAQLYGTQVVVHPSCPLVNTNADRAGAVLSDRAFGFLWKWRPRIAYERDESLRAYEVVMTACYAVAELDGTMGIAVVTDA